MKTLFVLLLSVILMTSMASAEMLSTANTTPQGRWAVEGIGLSDTDIGGPGGMTSTSYGIKGGYGIMDNLDLSLAVGSSTFSNLGAGVGKASLTAITAVVKYNVVKESAAMPVSVAVGLGTKALEQKMTITVPATVNLTNNGNKTGIGVIVSKVMAPFIPYGGITYAQTMLQNNTDATSLEITLGTGIAWSQQGAVFVEYTNQSVTPSGGTAVTTPQIGVGVGYII